MKRLTLILLAVLPAMVGWSQDTVQSPLRDNYFMNAVPSLTAYIGYVSQAGDDCGVQTKEMYSKDSLKIYGIAACLVTEADVYFPFEMEGPEWDSMCTHFWTQFRDTTTEECYEYLGIYLRSGDSLVPHREVMAHRKYDTPAYYVATGRSQWYFDDFTYPIYEKYFEEPIVVADTFYVGSTQRSQQNPFGVSVYDHMSFMLMRSSTSGTERHIFKYCWPDEGSVYWAWPQVWEEDHAFYLIYPILTPDPNAPQEPGEQPGDTTGISQADMVSRYVTVQPNPVTEEAQVLSSFGIERIDAYTADGRCILSQEANGLQATLDVRGWASGTYLLRVATPMGTATKKLLVR